MVPTPKSTLAPAFATIAYQATKQQAQQHQSTQLAQSMRTNSAVLSGNAHFDKDEFHRRIEQIKSSNESVGKNLEGLEKSTPAHGVIPQGD